MFSGLRFFSETPLASLMSVCILRHNLLLVSTGASTHCPSLELDGQKRMTEFRRLDSFKELIRKHSFLLLSSLYIPLLYTSVTEHVAGSTEDIQTDERLLC